MIVIDYGGGQSITLPRVQMGNTDTVLYSLNNVESRGGTQSQSTIAPINEIRHYNVLSERKTTITDFKALVRANLGKTATITDDEARTYVGLLLSESVEIVTVKDNCGYDFEFDILVLPAMLDYILCEDGQILLAEDNQELLLEFAP